MGAKIFNVGLKNVHFSPVAENISGPGFYINTVRTFSNFYPAVGDWTSGTVGNFRVNMGQNTFQGDPLGFQPYDTSYSDSKWVGSGTISNGLLEPSNLGMFYYDKQYTSGKYYFEVEVVTSGITAIGMHNGNSTSTGSFRNSAAGAAFYPNKAITWLGNFSDTNDYTWSNFGQDGGVESGEYAQVYIDFDNQIICVRKLNATKDQYVNFIEL